MKNNTIWALMIALHAIAGLVSFVSGLLVLSPKRTKKYPWAFAVYTAALLSMVLFVASAMAAHWQQITVTEQLIFSGLIILGLYMLYRALHAKSLLRASGYQWEDRYMDDIGFTLIALFDGFIIVGAIDLGMPGWVVGAGAVAAIFIGNFGIERYKHGGSKTIRS